MTSSSMGASLSWSRVSATCLLGLVMGGCSTSDDRLPPFQEPGSPSSSPDEAVAEREPTVQPSKPSEPPRSEVPTGALGAKDIKLPTGGGTTLAQVGDVAIGGADIIPLLLIDAPNQVEAAIRDRVLAVFVRREAERLGLSVSRDEIERKMIEILDQQAKRVRDSLGSDMNFEQFVRAQYGLGVEAYREIVKSKVVETALLERLVRYQARLEDRFVLGVILIKDRLEAEDLLTKLRGGANFEALARQHSLHPTSSEGGLLPPLPTSFESPLTSGANALAVGQLTEVEEVATGPTGEKLFRILKLVRLLPAESDPWEVCAPEIESDLAKRPVEPMELPVWEQRMQRRYQIKLSDRDAIVRRGE